VTATNFNPSPEAICIFDPTSLDKPEEEFAERFGIPVSAAQRILDWHSAEVASSGRGSARSDGETLYRVLSWLMGPGNAQAKTVALCFAADLQTLIGGWSTLSDAAREVGITPAALSKLQIEIQTWLQLPETQWNRTKYRLDKCKKNTKKRVTLERVAQQFRLWMQRSSHQRFTKEQKRLLRSSLNEVVAYAKHLES
jgi:hypothetical protein